ncbi:MAG: glycosyltransferase family 25 protein [Prevotella sp.]|nr:glycosyltransferase family 25 protein [Prevotella sp.]
MSEIQVLVIHVRGHEDRRRFIQKQLDKLGFPYEFILDGNVEDLTPEVLDRYFIDNGKPDTMYGSFPRTSCAYKEFLAYKYILDNNLEGALILEDDIRLFDNFTNLFLKSIDEYTEEHSEESFIANYEESSLLLVPKSRREKGKILYPAQRDRFTGCYYLNCKAAECILSYVNRNRCDIPLDRFLSKLIEMGLIQYYWSHPCLACQCSADGSMPTTIPTKPRPWKRLKWFYKRIYKHLLYYFR